MTGKTEKALIRRKKSSEQAEDLKLTQPHSLQRSLHGSISCLSLKQEEGASSWLTALSFEDFGFTLDKGSFKDILALRYNWQPCLCHQVVLVVLISPYRSLMHCLVPN